MDITGRQAGYRGVAIRCPGCAEPMTIEALAEADVDVCGGCGGIWIDWFDGELRRVATETVQRNLVGRPSEPGGLRNEAVAFGACPRCTRQLAAEKYVMAELVPATFDDAEKKTAAKAHTVDLLRCEECAGAFVSRDAAQTMASLTTADVQIERDREEPGAPSVEVLDPMPWQRLVALLKRLFGRNA